MFELYDPGALLRIWEHNIVDHSSPHGGGCKQGWAAQRPRPRPPPGQPSLPPGLAGRLARGRAASKIQRPERLSVTNVFFAIYLRFPILEQY